MAAHSQPEDLRQSPYQRMRFGDFEHLGRRQKPSSAGGAIPRGGLRGAPFRRGISTSGASKGVCSVDRGGSTRSAFKVDPLTLNGRRYLPHLRSPIPSLRDARSCSDGRHPERGGLSTSHAWRTYSEYRAVLILSASPMTYHEGIVFQPMTGALSVKQRAAKGRWVAARRAATSGDSADAKIAPKYFAFT